MKNPSPEPSPPVECATPPECPFGWRCQAGAGDAVAQRDSSDEIYVRARRQGIYLAACIVDEVAAMQVHSPETVIDEIRRRICELVSRDLQGHPGV